MKNRISAILITLICLTAPMAWSADFQKGLDAAQNGDYATALHEWEPLAEQGYADAQFNLALMYDLGTGVPQDYKTAAKWYTRAAEQGDALAQYNLGGMYRKGKGVAQDYKIAMQWYTRAAKQGNARAQTNLGVMYYEGTGVLQDYIYAHMWLNIGNANGNERAGELRDIIAQEKMTAAQTEKAQSLARECVRKNYKGC